MNSALLQKYFFFYSRRPVCSPPESTETPGTVLERGTVLVCLDHRKLIVERHWQLKQCFLWTRPLMKLIVYFLFWYFFFVNQKKKLNKEKKCLRRMKCPSFWVCLSLSAAEEVSQCVCTAGFWFSLVSMQHGSHVFTVWWAIHTSAVLCSIVVQYCAVL